MNELSTHRKRCASVLLTLVFALVLAGCASNSTPSTTTRPAATQAAAAPAETKPAEKSSAPVAKPAENASAPAALSADFAAPKPASQAADSSQQASLIEGARKEG